MAIQPILVQQIKKISETILRETESPPLCGFTLLYSQPFHEVCPGHDQAGPGVAHTAPGEWSGLLMRNIHLQLPG